MNLKTCTKRFKFLDWLFFGSNLELCKSAQGEFGIKDRELNLQESESIESGITHNYFDPPEDHDLNSNPPPFPHPHRPPENLNRPLQSSGAILNDKTKLNSFPFKACIS